MYFLQVPGDLFRGVRGEVLKLCALFFCRESSQAATPCAPVTFSNQTNSTTSPTIQATRPSSVDGTLTSLSSGSCGKPRWVGWRVINSVGIVNVCFYTHKHWLNNFSPQGTIGFEQHIDKCLDLSQYLYNKIKNREGFQMVFDGVVSFSNFLFKLYNVHLIVDFYFFMKSKTI